MTGTVIDQLVLHRSIEQFLILEAELLDRREFATWLSLLDDEMSYLVPVQGLSGRSGDAGTDAVHTNHYVDETKAALARRVRRLELPTAWSEHPPSRICRFVANVRVVPGHGELFKVASSLLIYRARLPRDGQLIAAARSDHLRRAENEFGWALQRREVDLLDSVIGMHNMSVIF